MSNVDLLQIIIWTLVDKERNGYFGENGVLFHHLWVRPRQLTSKPDFLKLGNLLLSNNIWSSESYK